MKALFVVYILINGFWTPGDLLDGWGSIVYETEAVCMERKVYAEEYQVRLKQIEPRTYDRKFECVLFDSKHTP